MVVGYSAAITGGQPDNTRLKLVSFVSPGSKLYLRRRLLKSSCLTACVSSVEFRSLPWNRIHERVFATIVLVCLNVINSQCTA